MRGIVRFLVDNTARWCSPLIAIVVAILLQSVSVQAQPCTCPTSVVLKTLNVCIDNATYNVTVYGCSEIEYAYPYMDEVCVGSGRQNQYTTITRVCFNGARPAVIDASKTFKAILCTMKPSGTDSSWNSGVIPPALGSIWCWTVMTPKCVTINQATGCIFQCGTLCCRYAVRWMQTASGPVIEREWKFCSDTGTECGQAPCVSIDCPTREDCCAR